MRSSSALLLLLVAAVAGFLAFTMWTTPASTTVLEGPVTADTPEVPVEGDLAALPDGPAEGGDRTEAGDAATTETTPDAGLTEAELASLDSNALIGLVIDAEGNGIPGCEVTFVEDGLEGIHAVFGGQLNIEGAPMQLTDERGAFKFVDLEPGDQHTLRVRHLEISMRFVNGVVVGDYGVFAEPPILLIPGKRIRGTVTNELDLPVVGAEVHLDGQWRATDPRPTHDRMSTATDNDGKYEILGVPDGTRCLTVVAKDLGQVTRIQSLVFSDKTGQAHLVNMKMLGAASCTGRVTDLDGNGIAGFDILAVDRKSYRDVNHNRATSGPDGSFSLPNLARGVYQFTVSAPGYKTAIKQDVQIPQENLSFLFDAQRLIHGNVVDAKDGKGLLAFDLQLVQYQGGPNALALPRGPAISMQSSGGGKFQLPITQAAGLWGVQASAPGYAVTVSEPFKIEFAGDVTDVLVAMQLGGTLQGKLLDGEGKPVAGGRITSRDNNWTDDAFSQLLGAEEGHHGTGLEVRSGHDGTFVLPNLRPADYQLIARSGQLHQIILKDLAVEEAGTLDVGVITMLPGGKLHGTLFDSESAFIRSGSIFLNPVDTTSGAPVRRCKSGFDGRWKITNIVPGEYRLSGKPPSQMDLNTFGSWPSNKGDLLHIAGGGDDLRDIHLRDYTIPVPPKPEAPTGQLSGKLTSAAGVALVGNQVRLKPVSTGASPAAISKTAREGTFTFLKLLPGDYDLFVPGQEEGAIRVTVNIDQWTHQDIASTE